MYGKQAFWFPYGLNAIIVSSQSVGMNIKQETKKSIFDNATVI